VIETGSGKYLALFVTVAALLAGCAGGGATKSSKTPDGELPTMSDQTSIQKRAAINLELAVGYYQRHENSVALDKIKLALAADPEFAPAYDMRALIYMDMQETRLADENFLHALRLDPANPDFNNNYGWFLCNNGHEHESIAYFETALKDRNYASPAVALDDAGMCSQKFNDMAGAEKYYKRAFNFDPANLRVNENLARFYFGKKDYEQAKFYMGRLIKANVTDANVLWLGIRIAHKSGDRITEGALGSELQRYHSDSVQYASYQRVAFDE
jgi:type IV pilus assembly protein PilF